jgi:hypothetical protein
MNAMPHGSILEKPTMLAPQTLPARHTTTARAPVTKPASGRLGIRRRITLLPATTRLGAVLLAVMLAGGLVPGLPFGGATAVAASPTYEVKFRVKGIVSTTTVQARDAGQAKKLVQAQYGGEATVLSVKRLR